MKLIYYFILISTILGLSNSIQAAQKGVVNKERTMQYNPEETRFLEEAEGKKALRWATSRTEKTKKFLKKASVYKFVKKKIESVFYDQRKTLHSAIRRGYVYNFWTDDKNPQGLWRRTLLKNYSKDIPEWEVLIDFDKLSKKLGKKVVFRAAINCFQQPNLYLIVMSFGGKDETFFQEWNLETKDFVHKGFSTYTSDGKLLEGRFTGGAWLDSDTIILNLVLHKGDVTESLCPNSIYIWKRGLPIEEAKKIHQVPKKYSGVEFNKDNPLLIGNIKPSLIYITTMKDNFNQDHFLVDGSLNLQKVYLPSDATVEGSFKEYVFVLLRSDWKSCHGSLVLSV